MRLRMFDRLAKEPGSFAETGAPRPRPRRLVALAAGLGREPFRDPAVRGIVLNSRDVTEHHEAVAELKRTNADLNRRVREHAHRGGRAALERRLHRQPRKERHAGRRVLPARLAEHGGWLFGHALVPVAGGDEMRVALGWYADDGGRFAAFREATEGTSFWRRLRRPRAGRPHASLGGRSARYPQRRL